MELLNETLWCSKIMTQQIQNKVLSDIELHLFKNRKVGLFLNFLILLRGVRIGLFEQIRYQV